MGPFQHLFLSIDEPFPIIVTSLELIFKFEQFEAQLLNFSLKKSIFALILKHQCFFKAQNLTELIFKFIAQFFFK